MYFKWMTYMVCELDLNKAIKINKKETKNEGQIFVAITKQKF